MDWSAFAQEQLKRLSQLPCRVDEMTEREYAIYIIATETVAALQYIAHHEHIAQIHDRLHTAIEQR